MKQQTDNTTNAPGVLLNQARIKAGLSVQQIAGKMNLSVTVIETIETGDQQQSISPAFYRGYLRIYAQLVGLDADTLVEAFNRSINQGSLTASITPTFETDLYTQRDRKLPIVKWLMIMLMLIVLSITLYFAWSYKFSDSEKQQAEIKLSIAEDEEIESTPIPSESTQALALNLSENTATVAAADPVDQLLAEKELTAIETEAIEESTAIPVIDSGVKLEMRFSGDCWVNVTDNSGEVLAMGIKRNGKIMELQGDAPFTIILGNSAVVTILYNERAVDLSSFQPGNRVELVLSANSEYL